jgi:hypothetical protein
MHAVATFDAHDRDVRRRRAAQDVGVDGFSGAALSRQALHRLSFGHHGIAVFSAKPYDASAFLPCN